MIPHKGIMHQAKVHLHIFTTANLGDKPEVGKKTGEGTKRNPKLLVEPSESSIRNTLPLKGRKKLFFKPQKTQTVPDCVDVKKTGINFAKQKDKQIFKILCR